MVDVTIRGAGIFGLSIAWACVQQGATVQVIDPNGVGSGSSGGLVGALAPHTPENWNEKKEFQFQSLLYAEEFWRDVDAVSELPSGYARTGRLQPIANDNILELAQARANMAKDLWQGKAEWSIVKTEEHDPWSPKSPTGLLIHDSLSARMHPRLACASLAKALKALGVEFLEEGKSKGAVIWATGYKGLEELSSTRGRLVGSGIKGQSALLGFDARDMPQLFADTLHIVPHENATVGIGSTSEREFDDPSSTDTQLDDVLARAIEAFPVLRNARVLERWAGVRPRAKSRAPMLGAHPFRTGEFIANGGFKIGFGVAPLVSKVMADLALQGVDNIPLSFKPEASL
ncbi:MAG: FAD-binding oxidoreductase [Paracoccaceae bacterium]|nr:FAD-binding oxidoreductase [Paracoccaceae bacterium]MDG1737822.1 FAD-binding oxidoreductase [Paracoccaceae bacterium]MDG2260071.1 FAD-binding oxidoreductase [Paracoccaceae bacterium]